MVSKKRKKFISGVFMLLISIIILSLTLFNNVIQFSDFIKRSAIIYQLIISVILSSIYLSIATIQEGKLSLKL